MIKQKLSDYEQSMYNFFSPAATFVAVCAIVYALMVTGFIKIPSLDLMDIVIISLASFRLIRLFSFDSILNYLRDRIAYHIKVVTPEGGEAYVEKTPVGPGYRRLLTTLIDCVWCIGIWTSFVTFVLYIISPISALLVVVLAITGVATSLQLLISLIATHYEACDMKNDEMRKTLGK